MAYYKIPKNSSTGLKITMLRQKREAIRILINNFCDTINTGITRSVHSGALYFGLSGVIFPEGVTPDPIEWKVYDRSCRSFQPRSKSRFRAEFDTIPKIQMEEFEGIIGNGNYPYSRSGCILDDNLDYYYIDVRLNPKLLIGEINIPDDCIEIFESEYFKVKGCVA